MGAKIKTQGGIIQDQAEDNNMQCSEDKMGNKKGNSSQSCSRMASALTLQEGARTLRV